MGNLIGNSKMSKIRKVFAVRGDFGNVGSGVTLGIFEDEKTAIKNAEGCGSIDCGGDGTVDERTVVEIDPGEYLLVDCTVKYKLNIMTIKSKAKCLRIRRFSHRLDGEQTFRDVMKKLDEGKRIEACRILHDKFGWTWKYCKELLIGGDYEQIANTIYEHKSTGITDAE